MFGSDVSAFKSFGTECSNFNPVVRSALWNVIDPDYCLRMTTR
jgi:hypothetical protein